MKQLQTLKSDLNQSRIVLEQLGDDIQEGEVLLKVEKFSFTSNNVTYGVAGDTIGYWNFFPAINNPDNTWGCIPVWGFAQLIFCGVCWVVILRYKSLIPLMFVFWLIEWSGRLFLYPLIGRATIDSGLYSTGITPGAEGAPYVTILLAIFLIISLREKK